MLKCVKINIKFIFNKTDNIKLYENQSKKIRTSFPEEKHTPKWRQTLYKKKKCKEIWIKIGVQKFKKTKSSKLMLQKQHQNETKWFKGLRNETRLYYC